MWYGSDPRPARRGHAARLPPRIGSTSLRGQADTRPPIDDSEAREKAVGRADDRSPGSRRFDGRSPRGLSPTHRRRSTRRPTRRALREPARDRRPQPEQLHLRLRSTHGPSLVRLTDPPSGSSLWRRPSARSQTSSNTPAGDRGNSPPSWCATIDRTRGRRRRWNGRTRFEVEQTLQKRTTEVVRGRGMRLRAAARGTAHCVCERPSGRPTRVFLRAPALACGRGDNA